MYLQTFNDPVWTVSEVGGIWGILLLIAGYLIYNLFDSIVEMVSDLKKWFKWPT